MADLSGSPDTQTTIAGLFDRTSDSIRSSLAPGTKVGRYTIRGVVGSGAAGTVYEAHDPNLERPVALKLIDRLPGATPDEDDAFLEEARLLAKLASPHVVAVFDAGRFDTRVYIAMEYVPGGTLRKWLEGERSRSEILSLFVQAGQGLADAHAVGVIHGDFKPTNVVVDGSGRARVLDFGLARPVESRTSSQSGVRGTPAYMAPELFDGVPSNERSDQFAFCVSLWEALTGRRPYTASNYYALAAMIRRGEIDASARARSVPSWLRRALRRGLRPDPEARWPSMEALLEELRRPRRGLLYATGTLAVVAVGATAWSVGARQDVESNCERSIRETRLWSEDRQRRVRDRLEAIDLPYAQQTAARAQARLDAFFEGWVRASINVCATPDDRRAPQLRTAAQICLRRSEQRFSALADELLDVTHDELSTVPTAIEQLPPPERCTDDPSIAAMVAGIPEDPQLRESVELASSQLSRAWALSVLGRSTEGIEAARVGLETAERLQFDPLIRDASLTVGVIEYRLDLIEPARDDVERAFSLSTTLGDGVQQLGAATELAMIHAVGRGDVESGRQWLVVARALVTRPEISDLDRAGYHAAASEIAQLDRREDEAIADLERALEILARTSGTDSSAFATNAVRLANLLRKTERLEEARRLIRSARDSVESSFGPVHPLAAETWNSEALIDRHEGSLSAAAEKFSQALQIWEAVYPPGHPSVAFALSNLCRLRADLGDFSGALQACDRAIELRHDKLDPDHPVLAYSISDRADILRRMGRGDEARDQAQRALESLERKLGPEHPSLGDVLTVLGRIELDAGDAPASRAHLRRALAARLAADYDHVEAETAVTRGALALALATPPEPDLEEARTLAEQAISELSTFRRPPTALLSQDEARLRTWLAAPR